MADQVLLSPSRAVDTNVDASSGAVAYFYTTGTTTPVTVYSDTALTTSLGTSITADSAGKFVQVFVASGTALKVVVKDSSDVELWTLDPAPTSPEATGAEIGPVDVVGDLSFDDSVKAILGDGGDFEIFHDGTHSYIRDVGTGNLYIDTNGTETVIRGASNATMGKFTSGGAVTLYNNGSAKLTTTSTGVTVTGALSQTSFVGVGAIGTTAMLRQTTTSTARSAGDQVAGSSLVYTNADGSATGANPSGTWELCGEIPSSAAAAANTSLWTRVS